MTYIIENANILKNEELCTASILVKNNQIAIIGNEFKRYSFTRMNADPYIMTPTFCIFDSLMNVEVSIKKKKEYFLQNFILKGCTTLLTHVEVKSERELSFKLKNIKLELLNSPIDYIVGIKVPLKVLNSSFIRKCKREKIPVIFIELQEHDDLSKVAWGWIREAMFPYNCLIVPILPQENRDKNRLLQDWRRILEQQKINHADSPLEEGTPIPLELLCKIGIFPLKSSLIHGSEVSYNLYEKNREFKNVDVTSLFHYHIDRLLVTVHKGVVIRARGNETLFRSGYGEHVSINRPSYFQYHKY
jgi:hypothetical protein